VPYLQSCYANIAADLGPREIPDRNKFGGEQKCYNYSNERNIRCNFDAKNTLAFNYLTMISGGGTWQVDPDEDANARSSAGFFKGDS